MGRAARVYFLTAYVEYLMDHGIKTEDAYIGDASRFLRFLIGQATPAHVEQFLSAHTDSIHYTRRLRNTLRKFYQFAADRLDISNNPLS